MEYLREFGCILIYAWLISGLLAFILTVLNIAVMFEKEKIRNTLYAITGNHGQIQEHSVVYKSALVLSVFVICFVFGFIAFYIATRNPK